MFIYGANYTHNFCIHIWLIDIPCTCEFTYTETLISFTCLCTVNLVLYTIIRYEYVCRYILLFNSLYINTLLFKRATSCTKVR